LRHLKREAARRDLEGGPGPGIGSRGGIRRHALTILGARILDVSWREGALWIQLSRVRNPSVTPSESLAESVAAASPDPSAAANCRCKRSGELGDREVETGPVAEAQLRNRTSDARVLVEGARAMSGSIPHPPLVSPVREGDRHEGSAEVVDADRLPHLAPLEQLGASIVAEGGAKVILAEAQHEPFGFDRLAGTSCGACVVRWWNWSAERRQTIPLGTRLADSTSVCFSVTFAPAGT